MGGKKRENQNRYIYKNPKHMHMKEYAFERIHTNEESDINPIASLWPLLLPHSLCVYTFHANNIESLVVPQTQHAVSLCLPLCMLHLPATLPSGSLRDGHDESYSLLNHQNLQLAIWC